MRQYRESMYIPAVRILDPCHDGSLGRQQHMPEGFFSLFHRAISPPPPPILLLLVILEVEDKLFRRPNDPANIQARRK